MVRCVSLNPIKKEIIYPILAMVMLLAYWIIYTYSYSELTNQPNDIMIAHLLYMLFIMYFGESLALFIYYWQRRNTYANNSEGKEMIPGSFCNKIKITLIIFILIFIECMASVVLGFMTSIAILTQLNMLRNVITLLIATIFNIQFLIRL